jgi:hypothetical protein
VNNAFTAHQGSLYGVCTVPMIAKYLHVQLQGNENMKRTDLKIELGKITIHPKNSEALKSPKRCGSRLEPYCQRGEVTLSFREYTQANSNSRLGWPQTGQAAEASTVGQIAQIEPSEQWREPARKQRPKRSEAWASRGRCSLTKDHRATLGVDSAALPRLNSQCS